MRGYLVFLLLAPSLSLGDTAQSAEPACRCWPWTWSWKSPHPQCPCCPNDYCPKKAPPCPSWVESHAPDDYCPKTLPHVSGVKCLGEDEYCSKPCPICLPPCPPPWYTCGSGVSR
jgi:hypothetical protein